MKRKQKGLVFGVILFLVLLVVGVIVYFEVPQSALGNNFECISYGGDCAQAFSACERASMDLSVFQILTGNFVSNSYGVCEKVMVRGGTREAYRFHALSSRDAGFGDADTGLKDYVLASQQKYVDLSLKYDYCPSFVSPLNANYVFYKKQLSSRWYWLYNVTYDAKLGACAPIVAPSEPPNSGGIVGFLSGIRDWFLGLWNGVFLSQSAITGNNVPLVGSSQTYHVVLDSPLVLDNFSGDGSYAVRYCSVGVVKKSGDVVSDGGSVVCGNSWVKDYVVVVPNSPGDYAVVGVMSQFNASFVNGAWVWGNEFVVDKVALNVATSVSSPGGSPSSGGLSSLWGWIKNLFGWLI